MKPKILVSVAFWSLGETSTAVEVAKALQNKFTTVFYGFGGPFEYIAADEGFEIVRLVPTLNAQKIKHLYRVDTCTSLKSYFTCDEISEQIKSELALYNTVKPLAIIVAFNFCTYISARIQKIPLFSIGHSTWLIEQATERNKINIFKNHSSRILQRWVLYLSKMASKTYCEMIIRPYNKIATDNSLKPFNSYEDWWSGDYTIMTEPAGFTDLVEKRDSIYVGAVTAELKGDLPAKVVSALKSTTYEKIIYLGMGSSARTSILREVIMQLGRLDDCLVIAPIQNKIQYLAMKIPPNFIITDWVSTQKLLKHVDIAVLHGGIGTLFSAVMASVPFVSIPMQPEQEITADCFVSRGIAIKIKNYRSCIRRQLLPAINTIKSVSTYYRSVETYQQEIMRSNQMDKLGEFIFSRVSHDKEEV